MLIYFKPFLKKILKLKNSFICNFKVLFFKKSKWQLFLVQFKNQLIKNKYRKFKFIDQNKFLLNFYSNKWNNYQNNYRYFFNCFKIVSLFFCKSLKNSNFFKKKLRHSLLKLFENQLDYVLYLSKLFLTIYSSRFYILNGSIFINNKKACEIKYNLKAGDLISCYRITKLNYFLLNSKKWFFPFLNVIINFNSLEIFFLGHFKAQNLIFYFPFHLKLNKMF